MLDQGVIQNTLSEALLGIRANNPAYSLRAFSRKLGISPAALSEILNGRRRVSPKMAERLCDRLCLTPEERDRLFSKLDRPTLGGSPARKTMEIEADRFHVISDWYYFAILSLSETDSFRGTPEFVSRRLGISIPQARVALDRLERLGLMKRNSRGRLVGTGLEFSSPDGVPDLSIRKNHMQSLELSKQALEQGVFDEQDFIATTLTFDPKKLPLAKKMIRRFRDAFCAEMEASNPEEVYRLNIQFIPLSRRENP